MHDTAASVSTATAPRKAVALLIIAGLLAYSNCFTKAFVFDDLHWISRNPDIAYPWEFVKVWTTRPLGALTFSFNYWLGETSPTGYHAFNVAVHICAGLALFGLVRRTLMLPPWHERCAAVGTWLAFTIALLWLVHPLQTQSVTYTIQRLEALMGLFYLLTLYCLVRGATGSRGWYVTAVVSCALGMASKEVMFTAPVLALLYDRVFLAPSWRELFRRRWGLHLGLAATWSIFIVGQICAAEQETVGFDVATSMPLTYFMTQAGVILHYLWLTVWPIGLCLDYNDWPVTTTPGEFLVPGAIVGGVFVAAVWALFRLPWLGFLGVSFFVILAPTSSFVPISDVVFEHRMYLPLAAIVALAVILAHACLRQLEKRSTWPVRVRQITALVLVTMTAGACIVRTWLRNEDYRDNITIWMDVVAKRPDAGRATLNLGLALVSRDPERAVGYLRAEYARRPTSLTQWNLAHGLFRKGDIEESLRHLAEVVKQFPDSGLINGVYAEAAFYAGDMPQSVDRWRKAVKKLPRFVHYHYGLGAALVAQGQAADAALAFAQGRQLDPSFPAKARRVAWNLLFLPAARRTAHHNRSALFHATIAAGATDHKDADALDVLAAAYAANGQFTQAIAAAEKARASAQADHRADAVRAIDARLQRYRRGLPFGRAE